MKNPILLVLILALMTTAHAQNNTDHLPKCYLHLAGGPSSRNGATYEYGGTAIFKNKWMASISYQSIDMTPKNLPQDYKQGYTVIIILPIPDAMPSATLKSVNFTVGKYLSLGRKTWITAEGGLSVVNGRTYTFTPQQVEYDFVHVSSNYAAHSDTQTGAGGIIKADFNWAFIPYLGLGVGMFANVNSIQSSVGLQFKVIAGWMNSKKGTR
jgi:hypothetical protein